MKIVYTQSSEETIELGNKIVQNLPAGCHTILLSGDLSAGKTTLTKGIAQGLGIQSVVNSPTFTILKIYEGIKKLYHFDLYRLDTIGTDFDLEEYILDEEGLSVIEWPHQVAFLIPDKHIEIKLTYVSQNERKLEILTQGFHEDWTEKL